MASADCGKEVVTVVRDDFFHDPFFKVAASSLLLFQFLTCILRPFLYLKDWWGDFEAPAGSWDKALQRQPSGRISRIQNHSNLKSINRRVTRHRLRSCLHVFHVSYHVIFVPLNKTAIQNAGNILLFVVSKTVNNECCTRDIFRQQARAF